MVGNQERNDSQTTLSRVTKLPRPKGSSDSAPTLSSVEVLNHSGRMHLHPSCDGCRAFLGRTTSLYVDIHCAVAENSAPTVSPRSRPLSPADPLAQRCDRFDARRLNRSSTQRHSLSHRTALSGLWIPGGFLSFCSSCSLSPMPEFSADETTGSSLPVLGWLLMPW